MISYEIKSEMGREELNRDQRLESTLKQILYQASCPSAQDLGEFQLGMLEPVVMGEINLHLQGCSHCSQELAQLDTFLAATEPSFRPNVVKPNKITAFVAELAQILSETPASGMAVRDVGESQNSNLDSYVYSYAVDGVQWEFDIEKSQDAPDLWIIEGSDIPSSDRADEQWQLEVWRTDLPEPERILLTEIDPLEMSVEGLNAGEYTLIFNDDMAKEIHIPNLQIG